MKFGIFYEHQLPRPWSASSEQQLISDALDQIELADRLGMQYLWEVEHHFLEEYSHSSAPEVFLAAASQRTRRMRIGHGVVQTAPGYNHPARIAERIAMLDLVSNGRVEFGSPASRPPRPSWAGSGSTGRRKRAGLAGGPGGGHPLHDRDALRRRERPLRHHATAQRGPQAGAEPHPPLWVACSRRDTILLAAEKGIGALSFAFVEPEDAAPVGARLRGGAGGPLRTGGTRRQSPGGLCHRP